MTTREDVVGWLLGRLSLTCADLPVSVERSWRDDYDKGPPVLYCGDVDSSGGAEPLVDLAGEPLRFADVFTITMYGHIYADGMTQQQAGELGGRVIDAIYQACARKPSPDDGAMVGLVGALIPVSVEGPTVLPYDTGHAALITASIEAERHVLDDDPEQVP